MVIISTPEMEANEAGLASLGALIWLGGNRPAVSAAEIKEALDEQFGIKDVKVVPHFPEDFFALFSYQHQRDRVTTARRFRHNDLDLHSSNWRLDAHSDVICANYHVHLCIESIPLNAWSDSVAAQVLGPDTFVHYFDIATLRQEDASCLRLWAWSANPSAIPKVQLVTIAPRVATGVGGAPSAAIGHGGIRRRAIVHLDLLEDFTPDAAGNFPRRPRTEPPFDWKYGVVDGEARARDRHEPPPSRRDDDDRSRRDDDRDRDDRRGRDNDRSRSSWKDRIFRSRSRAPDHRADDGRQGPRWGARESDRGRDDRGRDDRRRAHATSQERSADGCSLERRGRSLPPSPRTTSSDIIEIAPSGLGLGWLCGASSRISKIQPSLTMEQMGMDKHMLLVQEAPASPHDAPPELVLSTPTPTPVRLEVLLEETNSDSITHVSNSFDADAQTEEEADEETRTEEAPEEEPISEEDAESEAPVTPIFIPRMPALLPSPPTQRSTPPRPPTARRKTLAGVSGFHLPRQSPRLRAKKRSVPIARLAEQLLCRRMGIVAEGEQATEAAITKFADMFQDRLPDIAVAALRALFHMDCDLSSAVEDALMQHGGEGGPDQSEATAAGV